MIAKLTLPFYSTDTPGKRNCLSLNWFFGLHWARKARIKEDYQASVYDQVTNLDPISFQVELHFTLIPPNKVRRDRSNVLAIHEKFICDALVKNGVLKDDNDRYITKTVYTSGGIDKQNPMVELEIRRSK